jgi:signal transduction histidine kinase
MEDEMSVIIICNMLNLMSSAIGADVVVCDSNGEVILCRHLITNDFKVLDEDNCLEHQGYKMSQRIFQMVDQGQFYTMDTMEGLYNRLSLVVVDKIQVNGVTSSYVVASEPITGGLWPFISGIFRLFLFAAIITILLSIIVVYGFTYSISRPLHEMSKLTKSYASGDFSKRMKLRENDELGDLATALNTMAKSLATLEASRRSFVANVSHELKTPMTTISGFIDGILDGTIPLDEQSHYLGIVSQEVKRLSRLVVSMLNLSKVEASELGLDLDRFNISEMLFNIFVTFEQHIEKKHIRIEGLDKIESVMVDAEKDLIYQVVYNLVDNAVKFTDEGGTISVSVAQDNEKVIAGIKNSGKGIPADEVSTIFERFYKVDKSRSENAKGAGLGLYLAKSIVELHGGQITAQSEEGKYSDFIFWIPKRLGR